MLRDRNVQSVLRVMKNINLEVIEPKIEFGGGIKYPTFEGIGISNEDVRRSLLLLCEAGILSSEVVDNVATCPHCQSHRLMIKFHCPSCGSSRLVRGRMIEHFACGHIDFEDRFRSGEGLFCPNCKKPLGQLGVDYRIFSTLYRCVDCRSVFSDPRIEYLCSSGHVFGENELMVYSIVAFKVNPEKRDLIENLTFDLDVILKPLRDEGLSVKVPVTLHGKSGVKHDFSFAISYTDGVSPDIVGSVHISERAASATDVLALWAKTSDAGIQHKVLITLSGVDEGGKGLAEAYGLKIIEGKSIEEIAFKVRDHVTRIIKENLEKRELSPKTT
ncbi:MAG: hypothetical protein QXT26_04325 [Thermoproteota archaeon]